MLFWLICNLFKDFECLTEVEEIKWRTKNEKRNEQRALTLSKAMFTFGKISKHVYEARKRKKK